MTQDTNPNPAPQLDPLDPDPVLDPAPAPDPALNGPQLPSQLVETPEDAQTGFAAFDHTLQRFIGAVHRGTGAKAAAGKSDVVKAAKDDDHDVEVVPV